MTSSYIEKVHLKKFRQFSLLDVEFNKGFNFIAGPNGCGKTSILAGISHCLNSDSFKYSRFQENAEFWVDITHLGQKKESVLGKTP
ncbi:AAA family ATPase [Aeromonas sp. FDAARGOS 1403]|uniref:AAA family ATPase n=1 Tax=Aeromonas TaxID=642 RepID=UPI001C24D567|nr:AAA family ATPase [Aeromonas sp. FDAARGOS 1403]QXA17579.1 AAA family ATPase [Aeromonas sp. FDAARGOS 1403]